LKSLNHNDERRTADNIHLCFVSSTVLVNSFELRNRQLLVAAKR
jgi:hypothetical protein